MKNFKSTHMFAIAALALFLSVSAFGQGTMRIVLKGHDPVAYFTDGKPTKGDPNISYDWDGGRYYFSNAKHRAMFSADPEHYAPQFAGYCTGSMARGVRNEGHPEGWVIADGKLFVFGAPDLESALKHKANAEKDLAAFRVKVATAAQNWRDRK